MKRLFTLLTFLLLSSFLFGQTFTTVSATLTDSSTQVWAGATVTVAIVPPFGVDPRTLRNQGFAITDSPQTVTANGSGAFSVVIDDNNKVSPAGSQWSFTMCPNATVQSCSSVTVAVTGPTLNLTSSLSNALVVPTVTSVTTLNRAYNDAEVNAGPAAIYFRTTDNSIRGCSGFPCTWSPISGSGSAFSGGSGASFQDIGLIAAPANPAAGFLRLFANTSGNVLNCLTPAGGSCLSAGSSFPVVTAQLVNSGGSITPSGTGQNIANTEFIANGPGSISPNNPTLAFSVTGGALISTQTTFVRLTYVGLAVTEPSGEVKITPAGCTAGNQCSITVTMPTSCTAGNLPAGVTGCTVWDSTTTITEKQQAASANCVNITTATCVIGTLAAGSTLIAPSTTGVVPPNAQANTCPDTIIPTSWFTAGDGNNYPLAGVDVSSINGKTSPPGVYTICGSFFVNDTQGQPLIANALVSLHHQAGNFTTTGAGFDDRTLGVELVDTGTASPIFEQSLTQYNERLITNNAFQCAPVGNGPPGESCAAAGRFIINDSRTSTVGSSFITGLQGVASISGSTAVLGGSTPGIIGVAGGAFQATNSQNGNSNLWVGGYFGVNAASGNTSSSGYGLMIYKPTVRFSTQTLGIDVEDQGSNVADWDLLTRSTTPTTNGSNYLQGPLFNSALVPSNGTYGISGSVSVNGGFTTTQLAAPTIFNVFNNGTAGVTTSTYKVTCVDSNGAETTASGAISNNLSNANITATNSVGITVGNQKGCSSYNFYRTVNAAQCNGVACTNGKLGNAVVATMSTTQNNQTTFTDTGQVGDGNTAVAQLNTTGNIVTSDTFAGPNGTAAAPTYSFGSNAGLGMFALNSNVGEFTLNNSALAGWNGSGLFVTSTGLYCFKSGIGSTACDSVLSRINAGTVGIGLTAAGQVTGNLQDNLNTSALYATTTNCSVNSVSPAACGAASSGAFVVPTTTATYTVNTTAVTANSRIFLQPISFASNLPSAPTCVAPAVTSRETISAVVAATSFTFVLPSTTGQTCWQYYIIN